MVTVFDVAASLLSKCGKMTTMKLQRLIYYSQAWSLVWDERPLFDGRIEAWANGPICPALYFAHRGKFEVAPGDIGGDAAALSAEQDKTARAVADYYGEKSSQWLNRLTHEEPPWRRARKSLKAGERGMAEITHAEMAEYYGSLC